MTEAKYEEIGERFNQRFEEVEAQIASLGEHAGDGVIDYQQLAAALAPYLDTERRSDEEIQQLISEYVDEHVEVGGPVEVDSDQLRAIVREELADIREDMTSHSDAFEFPARRVGPTTPAGDYHSVPMWGVHFKTGRECYIRSARIDAREAGSFTAQVGKFDGGSFEKVDEKKVTVSNKGSQRVTLDLQVPGPGEYLLTRPEEFAMRRTAWNGWQSHMVDNLRLIGGNKPDELGGADVNTSKNQYYYYFMDCEFVANQAHKLQR